MNHANILCRYGPHCKKIQEGTCQFRHLEVEDRKETRSTSNVKTKRPYIERSRSRSQEEKRQYKKHDREEHNRSYISSKRQVSRDMIKNDKISHLDENQNRRKKYRKNHHPHHNYQPQQNYKQNIPQTKTISQSPPLSITQKLFATFCKSYHLEDKCDDLNNCKKIHAFLFKEYDRIKRLIFRKNIQLVPKSTLNLYEEKGNLYYIIKSLNKIFLYSFTPDKRELTQVRSIQLYLQKQLREDYFKNTGTMLYFSFVNQITSFYDLTICDAVSNKSCSIKNAHLKQVTGMIHIGQQQIVSVSLDGDLKVWNITSQHSFVNNKQKTARFKQLYNPNNIKIALNFIQTFKIDQITYICVGSSNSRIFLFSSNITSAFKELNIVKIKFTTNRNAIQQVLLLAKIYQKSIIFKAKLSDLKFQMIFQQSNQNNRSIHAFQIYQDLLMVSCANEVVFYRLPYIKVTIGVIFHRTPIKNIVVSQYQLKSTAVKFPMMAILQAPSEECKESGSFSIYLIK